MAELPSGAITFLFTDIEGSTRLLKQLRGRYAEGKRDPRGAPPVATRKVGAVRPFTGPR